MTRAVGLRENALELVLGETLHLDSNRKPTLELRDQVRWPGPIEGAGADEQDVVSIDDAKPCTDARALHDGQQITLDALA